MHLKPAIATLLDGLNNPSLPGIDLSLTRMVQLLAALGNPEKQLPPVIHLAGTNGKGSTLAFLKAIYEAAGYRVHAYSSPHLVRFNERIVLAGQEISDDYLLQLLERITEVAKDIPVTFFEATTAAAFLAFAEHSADVVLLETGLGGRLDATNVVARPIATIITPIDYDHMEFLGETLGAIAAEKAGIIKDGVSCFVGSQQPEAREVLKRTAREKHAELLLHGRDWSYEASTDGIAVHCGAECWELPLPSLVGMHQYHNAALASVAANSLRALPVSEAALKKGIVTAEWPARLQRLTQGPLVDAWGARGAVMLDGGHNTSAALVLRDWIAAQEQPVTLMLGMMARKDAHAFLEPLADCIGGIIAVPIAGNDAYAPDVLAAIAGALNIQHVEAAPSLDGASLHMREGDGTLLIAGSLFLAGEVLKNHS